MTATCNIELKVRLEDLDAARARARLLATHDLGAQRQTDTYFHCPHGRLKLREIEGGCAQLVSYQRPDQPAAKASDYLLVDVPRPELLKVALTSALGVDVIVSKRREILLHHNVRIHLDEVAGLGVFLEFEAVLTDSIDDEAGHAQVARLCRELGIAQSDWIAQSYADLLRDAVANGANSLAASPPLCLPPNAKLA